MNIYLEKFINNNFLNPGKVLDLGAGDFSDIKDLQTRGWICEGVDKKTGVDLEQIYISTNKPFDLVYSNYVLHFLKNKQSLIDTAYENLKKDGWLFLHVFHKNDENIKNGLTEEETRTMLKKFKNISIKVFDFFDNEIGHNHWHKIMEVVTQKK
ncbi:MAG: methyltransferase domain-containing protein [Patescibacteria group bacterium]